MIRVKDFSVVKAGRTICQVRELSVEANQIASILGANGCGKSTLLRVLAGIEKEFSGTCEVDVSLTQRCYVHQRPFLFRGNVLSNVGYGLRARGVRAREATKLAEGALAGVGMHEQRYESAKYLSGGERRRVALARAFVLKPKLLLLDEPFADLDEGGISAVCATAQQMNNCTIVIASPQAVPSQLASRVERPFSTDASFGVAKSL